MKKLLFLLLVSLATAASASANSGKWKEEDKHKAKEKEKEGEKANKGDKKNANCDSSDKTVTTTKITRPSRVEEYVWMLPKDQDGDKMYEEELKKGILDLYKWYLQNESRINSNETLKTASQELAFPFKVDAKTLQQYFQFVKNNFPGLSEDDLTDGTSVNKKPVANRKKYAPVSSRDEMESQMTIPVNK